MRTKNIVWFGQRAILSCDGNCSKAWGISLRPSISFNPDDPDDFAYLSDGETDDAPEEPGTWEGGHGKPFSGEDMNKWCSRQCERSVINIVPFENKPAPDFSERRLNQPWKHGESVRKA